MKPETKKLYILLTVLCALSVLFWTAALSIAPPPATAGKEVWEHYHHKGGMIKALLIFLGISTSLGGALTLAFLRLATRPYNR